MSKAFVVGVAVATLCGHWMLNTQRENASLKFLLQAANKKEQIQDDQIRELIYNSQQMITKTESLKAEGFVAGVLDMLNKPEHYNAIWHDGYNRGTSVTTDMMKAAYHLKPEPDESGAQPTPLTEATVIPPRNKE